MPVPAPARGATGATERELEARRLSRRNTLLRGGNTEFEGTDGPPVYNLGRIRELQQEQAAAGTGRARRGLREALATRGGDVRAAVRGFGESQAAIQAGAAGTAASLYQPEYQRELLKFQREEREREKDEAAVAASGRRDPSSETYRTATARLLRPQAGFNRPTSVATPSVTNYSTDILAGTGL